MFRKSLDDYKKLVEEKSKRWDEIELICGFRIRDNQSMMKVKDRYSDYSQLSQSKDSTISNRYTDEYILKLQHVNSGSFSSSSSNHSQTEVGSVASKTESKSERYKEASRITNNKNVPPSPSLLRGHSSNPLARPTSSVQEDKLRYHRHSNNNTNLPRTTSQDSFLTVSSKQGSNSTRGIEVNNNSNSFDAPDQPKPVLKKRFDSVLEDDTESVKSLSTDSSSHEKKKKKKHFKKIFKSS